MANEKKEKNEAIPMGGSTTDGTKIKVSAENAVAIPELKKKKVSPVSIVILVVAALLIALLVGAGVLFAFATTDNMPSAPVVKSEMSTVIKDSALEMISDKKITFTSDEVNLFLNTLVENSSDRLAENGVTIKDLFVVINNDKATIYCRAVYKGITWPIKAVAEISFDDPYIVVGFSSASIGKLNFSTDKLIEYFGKGFESEDISVHNGFIYYDTTTFNDKLSDLTLEALGLTPSDITSDSEDGDSNDDEGFSWSKWWNSFIGGISNTFKDWAAKLISDFIHDIHFEDVKILNDEIVLNVSFGEKEAESSTADSAA